MEPLPVKFWEIGSPVPERAMAFYSSVCGWDFGPKDEIGYYPAESGSDGIPGGIFDTQKGPPFGMICVQVPDLNRWIELAIDAGGGIAIPPTKVPDLESMFAVVLDPDGNRLGFFWQPQEK